MKSLLCAGCLLCGAAALAAADQPAPAGLYERVAARLAARPDLATLGQPPKELETVAWMLGRWTIEASVYTPTGEPGPADHGSATITWVAGGCWLQFADSYPKGTQDLGFLTYNPVTRRWVTVALDSTGNAVTISATAWEGNRLVFEAPAAEIVGERVHLRQTLEKLGPDEFVFRNEERFPDGTWRVLDRYRYRRQRP